MRLILAVWAAKLSSFIGKIIGKKSTATPGVLALKICPDLIKRLKKNVSGVIVTCGTNGKTTTNNLIYAALRKSGYKVLCNDLGANMLGGVATTFAMGCNIFGKLKADYACLEIDEASTVKVFDHLTPDYMVVTNLFRDQLDRYGEIETTVKLIETAIEKAPNIKLVLNGDDPITAQLGKKYDAVYFGISEKVLPQTEEGKEGQRCVYCGEELKYNYYHYSQLGDYYCESCDNKRNGIDFEATNVDISKGLDFTVNGAKISLNYRGFYNIYNVLAVYSVMSLLGAMPENFNSLLENYKPQIGRMEEFDLGKTVILNLAKNPAGFNQAISTVVADKRKKDIIIAVNAEESDGMDVSWLWDVEFENLADETLGTLKLSGKRMFDLGLRFKYADIKIDEISENIKAEILSCLKTDAEVLYVLVNYTMLFKTQQILLDIKKEMEGGK